MLDEPPEFACQMCGLSCEDTQSLSFVCCARRARAITIPSDALRGIAGDGTERGQDI